MNNRTVAETDKNTQCIMETQGIPNIFHCDIHEQEWNYAEVSKSGDEHDDEHILHFFSVKICIIHNKINRMACPAKLIYTNIA